MIDEVDISDEELEKIAEEKKRHKELIAAITKLAQASKNKDLTPEIQRNNDLIVALLEKISGIKVEQKELPAPQVNVTTDNEEVCEEIKSLNVTAKALIKNQEKIIELLNMKPSKLSIVRNSMTDTLSGVEIEYKKVK